MSAGTLPLALVQQFDVNGAPLSGCIVSFFVAGTVAAPQNAFADFGLTQSLGNQITCDQSGRVPLFWLADGLIHVRLTDSSGVVQVDNTMQVLGPSSGGGGGGGTIDPTTIAQTGDEIFRHDTATRTGWVIENGQTIGSAASGASQRANADTQNLYVFLWTTCSQPTANRRCAVVGGLGGSALADFTANKPITLYDMLGTIPVGRDCMGNSCAGRFLAANVTSGGGDGVDTLGATGGLANFSQSFSLTNGNLPPLTITNGQRYGTLAGDLGYAAVETWDGTTKNICCLAATGSSATVPDPAHFITINFNVSTLQTGLASSGTITVNGGNSAAVNLATPLMNPFSLVTYYMKL